MDSGFPMVAIGASAGGDEALCSRLTHLPQRLIPASPHHDPLPVGGRDSMLPMPALSGGTRDD